MTASPDTRLAATRAWVETFVVAREICPFAGREVARDAVRYVAVAADDREAALLALIEECRHLDDDPDTETTLLVMTEGLGDFDDYLDFLAIAEALLVDQGYEGTYQLASFHPHYVFEDTEPDDAANYTNRSPWPLLHLLREASLERALAHHPDPEGIPDRNIESMRALGRERLAASLASLRQAARKA